MWEPRHPTALWASAAYYRDSLTPLTLYLYITPVCSCFWNRVFFARFAGPHGGVLHYWSFYQPTPHHPSEYSNVTCFIRFFFWSAFIHCDKTEINGRGDSLRWPRDTLYPLKLALTSPTSGGGSVGIIRLRTKTTEFFFIKFTKSRMDNQHLTIETRIYIHVTPYFFTLQASQLLPCCPTSTLAQL
jgi:hypothetical protein